MISIYIMQLKKILSVFFNTRFPPFLYILLAVIASGKQYFSGSYNNYKIFKHTFWHTIHLKPLYTPNPSEYLDLNHYGPFFSIIIAPFAILPDVIGLFLWNIANTIILIIGIKKLTLNDKAKNLIFWLCAHELLTALFSFQFNVAATGLILLSFSYVEKRKEFCSALTIVVGAMVKLYGIIGIAFFFFVKNKPGFIVYGLLITCICFALPMLLSNPDYVFQGYKDWIHSIVEKNDSNKINEYADLSLFGFMRRALHININNIIGVGYGVAVLIITLLRKGQHDFIAYRYSILSYLLLCIVLLNTNVESPTYIIGFLGVAIWYVCMPKSVYTLSLLIFALILTSFSPSDLFPKFIRDEYVRPYALKALPCILVWIDLTFRLLFANFQYYFIPTNDDAIAT